MDLSRRAIILIYGRAFSFFLSQLIPKFLSRLLLKEDYGSYQQLIVIYTIVQFYLLGMPQSLLYYFPRREAEEHPLLIRQTWTILLLSSLAVAFLFGWVPK